uniref:Transmembrane protein n=1 Tax=Lepisosteus oculatus TaxID=7918 RepID=W5MIZ7_LEPOC
MYWSVQSVSVLTSLSLRDPSSLSTRSSQWSFSTLSSSTQRSYRECFSWTRHPLILKNRRVVCASFLLLFTGLGLSVSLSVCVSLSSPRSVCLCLRLGWLWFRGDVCGGGTVWFRGDVSASGVV